jgi:hypothetical protein
MRPKVAKIRLFRGHEHEYARSRHHVCDLIGAWQHACAPTFEGDPH